MYKLLSGGYCSAANATWAGSVESNIARDVGASIFAVASKELNTSAVKDDPPIPNTSTRSIFACFISSAKAW
jgi:hypothetical protein